MLLNFFLLILFFVGCASCTTETALPATPTEPVYLYDSIPQRNAVVPMILETSGIADSRVNPGYLWAHEDSGNETQLFLLDYKGAVNKKIYLKGTINRDWEEMALSGTDIFIADIGDNRQIHSTYTVYQFKEPKATVDTVTDIKSIRFEYPDRAHDAEALLIDQASHDVYIITKRETASMLFKLKAPFSYTDLNIPVLVATLPYTGVVAAAQSANGQEIIIKTYTALYHYTRAAGESLETALTKQPQRLGYQAEPQGEAITFALDNTGFFTLSEKGFSSGVNLHFYSKQ